jgi:hypothetical protein
MEVLAGSLNIHLKISNNTSTLLDVGSHVLQVEEELAMRVPNYASSV